MKVLWISPPFRTDTWRKPLGLAVLKSACDVSGIKSNILSLERKRKQWKGYIRKHCLKYDVYGIALFDENIYYALQIVTYLKKHGTKGARIIVGGPACRANPGLIKHLFKGVEICEGDGFKYFGLKSDNLSIYNVPVMGDRFKRNVTLRSFGCPYHCTFCVTGKYVVRNDEEVIKECEGIVKSGYNKIVFYDGTFALGNYKEFIKKWLKNPILKDIKISCTVRIANLKRDDMKWLSKICFSMYLGLESFTDEGMGIFNKGFTWNTVKDVIDLLYEYPNIVYQFSYIVGNPWETNEYYDIVCNRMKYISSILDKVLWIGNVLVPSSTIIRKLYPSARYNVLEKEPKSYYYPTNKKRAVEIIELGDSLSVDDPE